MHNAYTEEHCNKVLPLFEEYLVLAWLTQANATWQTELILVSDYWTGWIGTLLFTCDKYGHIYLVFFSYDLGHIYNGCAKEISAVMKFCEEFGMVKSWLNIASLPHVGYGMNGRQGDMSFSFDFPPPSWCLAPFWTPVAPGLAPPLSLPVINHTASPKDSREIDSGQPERMEKWI